MVSKPVVSEYFYLSSDTKTQRPGRWVSGYPPEKPHPTKNGFFRDQNPISLKGFGFSGG